MADFSSLKQTIQMYVKQNGNEEITGNILQDVLLAIVTTLGDGAINALSDALQTETANRQNADNTLQGSISNESGIRQQADTTLGGRIDGLETMVTAITNRLAEGCLYIGLATPSTNPGSPSGKVFYIALQGGQYTYFGNLTVTRGISILRYGGSSWSLEHLISIDVEPTMGSNALVESSGVESTVQSMKKRRYDTFHSGGYIQKGTGNLNSHSDYLYSDFIPCLPNQQFFLHVRANSDAGLCFYKDDKTYLSGINVNVDTAITVPAGAYAIRTSCSTNIEYPSITLVGKSLEDFDVLDNDIWEEYSLGSAQNLETSPYVYGVSRMDLYKSIRFLRLYGFDMTKKHSLYVLWGGIVGSASFSFRVSEQNADQSWNVVYSLNSADIISGDPNFVSFDETKGKRRVVALIDRRRIKIGFSTFNNLDANPELVFSKSCYYEDVLDKQRTLDGEGAPYEVKTSDFSISGFIYKDNGNVVSHETYLCTDFKAVLPGQVYKTNSKQSANAAICFYDASKAYTNEYLQNQLQSVMEFTIPAGVYFMRLSCSSAVSSPYAVLANYTYEGLRQLTTKINAMQASLPINTVTKMYPMTKLPCVSFQFDDNSEDDSQIVDLFESYKKTCAFAFIGSSANIQAYGSKYADYQKRGFQIMNHSINGNVLNLDNYTYQTALAAVFAARENIESAGMVCNGFVCPSSGIEPTFKPILKLAHCYAFTTATADATVNGRTADRCDLHRHTLQGSYTLQQLKTFIDDCITNDQIITFYGHSYDLVPDGSVDEFSIAQLTALIEYCITKEKAGELFFAGTDECVKYFFDL